MRLMRLGAPGNEFPAVYTGGGVYQGGAVDTGSGVFDLRPITRDIDGAFLASDGIAKARAALAEGVLPKWADTPQEIGERIGAPIARPGAVVCIGMNYAAHAAESGSAPPEQPVVFFKHPNTVVGPDDDVHVPRGAARTDWEVELAVVIGRRARYLDSPADAAAHIAGYAISNDVSERDFQLVQSGGQWSKGKCCETFNPLGPWLVPAEEVPDPQSLRLRSFVNDEPRQDSSTADMIFGVHELVWHLSQFLVLDPGDIINTGTPQGVALGGRFGYLAPGDTMELDIDRLGRQRQRLVPAP